VHRVQLATRLAFAAALSEAAPLAVEAFAVAAVVDSAAAEAVVDFTEAEAVEDMAAVAAVSEMERRHNLSSHCPAPTLKNLIS
jgi:preprotein translocase subunit Sec63